MVTSDRVAILIRMDRAMHARLWDLYYQSAPNHRQSFNAWIGALLAEGMTAAWYAADCPPARA